MALFFAHQSYSQLATTDPMQISQNATLISHALETFKKTKEIVDEGKKHYKEFVQIKTFLETTEERLKNIGDIKNLRLNKIDNIMDKVLAIKTGDYFSGNSKYQSVNYITQTAFDHADKNNNALYNTTYAAKLENLESTTNNSSVRTSSNSSKYFSGKMNEFNIKMKEGQITQEAMSAYSSKMKLDLAVKYKAISDELVKLSDEISLAINLDKGDSRNIPLSPSERMKMMDMANQYQIQALEYEEKSANLLEEASKMNDAQAQKLSRYKNNLVMKQMINFKL